MTLTYCTYVKLIVILALIFNLYKLIPMVLHAMGRQDHYYIFPWQGSKAQASNSNGFWLIAHLIISIIHVIITANLICPLILISDQFRYLIKYAFEGLILMNIWNLGSLTTLQAILVNGTLLALSYYFYESTPNLYYFIITLPVLLEALLFIKSKLI
jgi:hypothetical protein